MTNIPEPVKRFLAGKRFVVAGVSRAGDVAANAVFKKLIASGYEAFPVNPNATEVEGVKCYSDIESVPGPLDGIVIATHPRASIDIVRQAAKRGIKQVWFHRSFGEGSVSQEALDLALELNVETIVGGCPLMFCEPVDIAHRCMKWLFQQTGNVPR